MDIKTYLYKTTNRVRLIVKMSVGTMFFMP